LTESEAYPLIIVSKFIIEFLAIHPFQDGNGRLSRALTTLLLLRLNYDYVPYSSLERVIEENKDQYYLSLRAAQTEQDSKNDELGNWITFFLECLSSQKNSLLRKLEKEKSLISLPKLSSAIILNLKDHGKLSLSEIVKITGANRNTVKSHLFRLINENEISKEGKGKGTVYYV
jgi:Fic family protein